MQEPIDSSQLSYVFLNKQKERLVNKIFNNSS